MLDACSHPVTASQASLVQPFLSSQSTALPEHAPAAHRSSPVQALPSLQAKVFSRYAHLPVALSQLSVVQSFLSSQPTAAPGLHAASWQRSPAVQASPSSQAAWLSVCVHPVANRQASIVQAFLSSQFWLVPSHAPPWQVSSTVQALPSLQAEPSGLALYLHWPSTSEHVPEAQPSIAHSFLVPLHLLPTQTSAMVQELSSLHAAPSSATCSQTPPWPH